MDIGVALDNVRSYPGFIAMCEAELTLLKEQSPSDIMASLWAQKRAQEKEMELKTLHEGYKKALIRVLRAMEGTLEPEERMIIWRFYILRQTNTYIAQHMYMDKRGVLRKKHDAIEKLREGN